LQIKICARRLRGAHFLLPDFGSDSAFCIALQGFGENVRLKNARKRIADPVKEP